MEPHIKKSISDELLQEASKLYDVSLSDIKTLDGFENFVYEFNRNSEDYILRLVHSDHRDYQQVQAEIEFIDYLAKNQACVSTVIHSKNDELVEKVLINKQQYFSVSCFIKGPGKHVSEEAKDAIFWENLGEQIGLFHHLTKDFKPLHVRHEWYEDGLYQNIEKLLSEDQELLSAMKLIMNKILAYPRTKDNYGLIHTDIHNGNLVIDDKGRITVFDFDDAAYKHFISDIAIVIFYQFAFSEASLKIKNETSIWILKHFLKGYKKHNILPREEMHHLQDFLKLREMTLYLAILSAGEDFNNAEWAQRYFNTYRQRIIDDEPFIDLYYVLNQVQYE